MVYGADNPGVTASAIIDEVVEARGTDLTLDERITNATSGADNPSGSASEIIDEVIEARDDNPDLNDRLENFVADEIPDAEASVRGLVSLGAQEWAGNKTLLGGLKFNAGDAAEGAAPVGPSGVLGGSVVTAAFTGTGTGETDAVTTTLPADTLAVDGAAIRIWAAGKTAAGASTRTIKIYWNGAPVITLTSTVASGIWRIEAIIIRTGAATQIALCRGGSVAAGLNTATVATLTNQATQWDTGSPVDADLTTAVAIKTTLQDSAAGTNVTQFAFGIDVLGSEFNP